MRNTGLIAALAATTAGFLGWLTFARIDAAEPSAKPPNAPTPVHHAAREPDPLPPELTALGKEALRGSASAADRLIDRFRNCHKQATMTARDWDNCHRNIEYWRRVARENGSAIAAQRLTVDLLASGTCHDAHRAEYWHLRSAPAYRGGDYLETTMRRIKKQQRVCKGHV
jgi:hypothetical protein